MSENQTISQKQRLIILGSTGSIGTNTLEVVRRHPDMFEVVGLACGKNINLLSEQVQKFKPQSIAISDSDASQKYRINFDSHAVALFDGSSGIERMVRETPADVVVNGLVGAAGLLPTLAAIEAGLTVALANKETMVIAGELVTRLAEERQIKIIPIDSEHSAIWQCLIGEHPDDVRMLYLTGSGGPFLNWDKNSLSSVTVEQALAHPRWKMGNKVTIDSSTLMNKGLEVIEAHWFFNLLPDKIKVVIHPESIIHSMVEFIDGSLKAQLGIPDMYLPIQYALTQPRRFQTDHCHLDIFKQGNLHFYEPDTSKFPCLNLALEALQTGGTAPAVLNAANEEAVLLFLNRQIPYTEISVLVEKALDKHVPQENSIDLDILLDADSWAREFVRSRII